jgi:glycosyltransferase involved in cell wall biosynthesis
MQPRVILLVPVDCERRTGGYIWGARVAQELRGLGWVVEEHALPPGFPRPDRAARAESARILAGFPDGAVILADNYALDTMPEVLAGEAGRLRLVPIVHHPFADEGGPAADQAALVAAEREALGHAGHIVVTSRLTAATLERDYAVPAARITVALPGVDRAPVAAGPGSAEIRLLAVGALIPRKDHLALIEALGSLRDLSWRLRIVGNLDRFPATVAAVRACAAALGIADRLELAGELSPAALAAARQAADLQVSASRHEGFGMALAEGIACGLPAVAVAGGAVPEWLTPEAALLTPPGDPAALAAALRHAIADGQLRRSLRDGALRLRARLPTWPEAGLAVERALVRAAVAT